MAKKQNSYRISGHVVGSKTRQGAVGLRVQAWDKDLVCNDLVGSAVTDAEERLLFMNTPMVRQRRELLVKFSSGSTSNPGNYFPNNGYVNHSLPPRT